MSCEWFLMLCEYVSNVLEVLLCVLQICCMSNCGDLVSVQNASLVQASDAHVFRSVF